MSTNKLDINAANQNCYQDTECTKLRVFLGDGSEDMLYTGQLLLHCTNSQQATFTPGKSTEQTAVRSQGEYSSDRLVRRRVYRRRNRLHSKSQAAQPKSTTNKNGDDSANATQTKQSFGTQFDNNTKVNKPNDDKNKVDERSNEKGAESKTPFINFKFPEDFKNESSDAETSREDKDAVEKSASHIAKDEKSLENILSAAFSPSKETSKSFSLSQRKHTEPKNIESCESEHENTINGAFSHLKVSSNSYSLPQRKYNEPKEIEYSQPDILHENDVNTDKKPESAIVVGKHTGKYGMYDDDVSSDKSTKSPTKPSTRTCDKTKIRKDLLNAHSRCYKIQRFLIQMLLAKLKGFASLPNDVDTIKELNFDNLDSLVLLLRTFLKCFDVQIGLNHSLSVLLDADGSERCKESEGFSITDKEDKDDLLVECRSLMNHTSFSKSLVCTHLSNPYSPDMRYSCGEDRIFCAANQNFCYYLPHGEGRLESLAGKLIYQGQWKNGKRWGSGKAFILSGSELSSSPKHFGMYEGSWWSNMRHGNGRMVFASSGEYDGGWQYDMISGMGIMTYPDGSSFEGVWDEDEPDGCGMFLWPNGNAECREYAKGQVQRVFKVRGKGQTSSPYNDSLRDYAMLRIKYQSVFEEKTQLLQMNSKLKNTVEQQSDQLTTIDERLNQLHDENLKCLKEEYRNAFYEKKLRIEQGHQQKLKIMRESHESKINELEEKISQVKKELEENKTAVICQICFDRSRDCILMPCTHMLYCRVCISKEKSEGRNRCPACRGAISGEITCNIYK